jgi:hypothetical protein
VPGEMVSWFGLPSVAMLDTRWKYISVNPAKMDGSRERGDVISTKTECLIPWLPLNNAAMCCPAKDAVLQHLRSILDTCGQRELGISEHGDDMVQIKISER